MPFFTENGIASKELFASEFGSRKGFQMLINDEKFSLIQKEK